MEHPQAILSEVRSDNAIRRVYRLVSDNGASVDVEQELSGPRSSLMLINEKKKVVGSKSELDGTLLSIDLMEDGDEHAVTFYNQSLLVGKDHKRRIVESEQPHTKRPKSFVASFSFLELLLNTKVENMKHLSKAGNASFLVAVKKAPAATVFKNLVEGGFMSCPVVSVDGLTCHGFIDLLDYVNYYVADITGREMGNSGTELWSVMTLQSTFADKLVKDMLPSKQELRNLFHPVHKGYSLFSALELLAREPHLHRVPIVDDNRRLINLITQSHVVDFIAENISILGSKRYQPLSDIPELTHKVFSIKSSDHAVEAFKLMAKEKVTGIAVVNNNGELVGNISTKDLRGIDLDGHWWNRLFESAHSFIDAMKAQFPHASRPDGPVYALMSDTLESVVQKINQYRVHRVYIIDEHKKPVGVVGLKEVLKAILPA